MVQLKNRIFRNLNIFRSKTRSYPKKKIFLEESFNNNMTQESIIFGEKVRAEVKVILNQSAK